jgi:hypothetical protein
MQTSSLPAVSAMTKAKLLEELKDKGVQDRQHWSVLELRALLKDLRMEGVEKDPMRGLASASLEKIWDRCLSVGLPVDASYKKAEMLILLRSYYEDKSGSKTLMAIGKHKGSSFEEILQNDPQYLEWARGEMSDNSHIMLKALVLWSHRMDGTKLPASQAPVATPTAKPKAKSNSRQPRRTSAASSKGEAAASSKGEAPSTVESFEIMTDPDAAEKDKKIQELEEELARLQGRNTTRRTTGTMSADL